MVVAVLGLEEHACRGWHVDPVDSLEDRLHHGGNPARIGRAELERARARVVHESVEAQEQRQGPGVRGDLELAFARRVGHQVGVAGQREGRRRRGQGRQAKRDRAQTG